VDEDYEEMAHIDFMGSLYLTSEGRPCWPSENIEAMLVESAKKSKEGKIAKMAIFVDGVMPIIYEGPKTSEELWAKEEYRISVLVRIGMTKVMRTRPIIRKWELEVPVQFDEGMVEKEAVMKWMEVAGAQIGLSDWRPRYGRFTSVLLS